MMSDFRPKDIVIYKPTGEKFIVYGLFDGKCGLKPIGGEGLFVADKNDVVLDATFSEAASQSLKNIISNLEEPNETQT
ncbi:hypothetical protein D7X94_08610 [Acutalibacter sp. 1XD8-33]|uniref:hypothetical protein n=1 Tax=Acutalibacter sp. 1XD8-33 TaxID=2320081 RepID=UPI000EA3E9B6|nr:hypothetical protein [Acutalibacter sp. 1XD8-33]RKJ40198.1 hypothetical protein D7X94_08610 [Acutalibacter sp. 1XD8-33]